MRAGRRGAVRPGLALLSATAVVLAAVLLWDARRAEPHPGFGTLEPLPRPRAQAVAAPAPPVRFAAFGEAAGQVLHVPVARPVAVLFHEASKPAALAISPYGRATRNENRTKFRAPRDAPDGPDYRVMSSRGRGRPATSAVDVVVREGEPVLSPVTGTVVALRRYRLYGRHPDLRLVIAPAEAPWLRVVMLHLARSELRAGDVVHASSTPVGVARVLPFRSQVDDYVRGGHPHVHLEVKRAS